MANMIAAFNTAEIPMHYNLHYRKHYSKLHEINFLLHEMLANISTTYNIARLVNLYEDFNTHIHTLTIIEFLLN